MIQINLIPFAVLWAALAVSVLFLVVYRRRIAHQESDFGLHVEGSEATRQASAAQKLDQVDRWGKLLTIFTVLYGIALGLGVVYQQFVAASNYLGK